MRTLQEAQGMQERGHEVIFAVVKGGQLVERARRGGFVVYELDFRKVKALKDVMRLKRIIHNHKIDLVNTHSSLDAWIGGVAARMAGKPIIRTRHLSTPIRRGLNSRLLYRSLADFVVTTSSKAREIVIEQAKIASHRSQCIPTGVNPFCVEKSEVEAFRQSLKVGPDDILVGTCCIVRSWKGIKDLMQAANFLSSSHPHIKWVVVGGGYLDQYRDASNPVVFVGHLEPPYAAMAAMDIFVLLSTANEGISQASLQAAYLERPLITTPIGGLPEVCINRVTGLQVPPASPHKVAMAVSHLAAHPELRRQFGQAARKLVDEKFSFHQTLDAMEEVYKGLSKK
jgi:glycosyltransferase involved in cell wall biosynthesis